jgi:D-alanine-D-alanine ligase-like ATP-grasp enzyme
MLLALLLLGSQPMVRGVSRAAPRNMGRKLRNKPNIAVLVSSYEGSDATTKEHDDMPCSPAFWVSKDFPYKFTFHEVKKATCYATLRDLVATKKHTAFFNLCDGAREEDRAGEDVIRNLQGFGQAYTGADEQGFEPSKVMMKMLASNGGIKTPPFAVVEPAHDVSKMCRHLNFPVIVKGICGYASVGITKDSKCADMKQLVDRVGAFLLTNDCALVEEFITGREGTVLVCADKKSPHGIKVFPPIVMSFAGGATDFQHFDNKWVTQSWVSDETLPKPFAADDPAYAAIIETARNAYNLILNKVGYGRVDFRIDSRTDEVFFLEINPNCGMFYEPKIGGDFADVMVKYDKEWNHNDFVRAQIEAALKQRDARLPWWGHSYNSSRVFSTRAMRGAAAGQRVFGDAVRPVPVWCRLMKRLGDADARPGCMIQRADDKQTMITVKHSCNPNLRLLHGPATELIADRPIRKNEHLTFDYATVRDEAMAPFRCHCGEPNCRKTIAPQLPQVRASPTARGRRAAVPELSDVGGAECIVAGATQAAAAVQAPSARASPVVRGKRQTAA